MIIKNYLKNSRKVTGKPNEHFSEIYNNIYNTLIKNYYSDLSKIKLNITYSTNKTSELFSTENNEKHLIYDQYLGQVFNMLNRLHFNSNEPKDAVYYSFKLLAEEFQLAGNQEVSLICALAFIKESPKYNSYKNDQNFADRLSYTLLQETFVIAHELGHYIFSRKDKSKIIDLYKEHLIDLINEKNSDINEINFIDSYLTDRHNNLYKGEGTYKDYLTEEQIKEFEKDVRIDEQKNKLELIKLINENDNLIEEIICDDIAVKLILSFSEKEFGVSVEKTLDALYVGMMNLRILGIISRQVSDFEGNKSDVQDYFKTSMIRLMSYRDKANYHYGLYLKDLKKGFEIQKKLTDSNIRYSYIISDSILFTTEDKLSIIKSKLSDYKKEFNFEEYQKQNDMIDEILRHNTYS
jgi:hypothetical protein